MASFIEGMPLVRAIVAGILVFILPGFAWSLVFFKKLSVPERAAFSFGISIALVVLAVLALNVALHVEVNGVNALVTIIVITVIPIGIYFIKKLLGRKSGASEGE